MPDALLDQLQPLIGEWRVETSLAPPGAVRARAVFEWGPGERYLVQRTEVDHPEAPDALCVVAADPRTGGFTQHYFDSRGVVRLYAMTWDDGLWTLTREKPDLSPLEFAQRFVGQLSADGAMITARWETRPVDGTEWSRDFDMTYERLN